MAEIFAKHAPFGNDVKKEKFVDVCFNASRIQAKFLTSPNQGR